MVERIERDEKYGGSWKYNFIDERHLLYHCVHYIFLKKKS